MNFEDFLQNLYGISSMSNDYEERVVVNTQEDDWVVDTAIVTDRSWTYETAVMSPHFRNNKWIIVGKADTEEDAVKVHEQWVDMMRNDPRALWDIYEEKIFIHD